MRAAARSLLKVSFKVVKWLVIAALAAVLLTFACWWLWPDEDLDPGVAALLAARPAAPPAADNGYFVVWGLRASPGMDPHAVGRAMVAEHERQVAAEGQRAMVETGHLLGAAPLAEPAFKACRVDERPCIASYRARGKEVLAALARHALLLDRYRSLRAYPHYSQRDVTWAAGSVFPELGIIQASAIVEGEIALLVDAPATRPAALRELAAEMRFWRRVLLDSDTLIAHLLATAVLERKYMLASEIMRVHPDVARINPAALADITRPLPAEKVNLVRALDAEFRQVAPALLAADPLLDEGTASALLHATLDPGFKRNATVNAYYRAYLAKRDLHARSPGQILAVHAAEDPDMAARALWRPGTIVYNPVGKILLAITSDLDPYGFRLHDLVGVSRLVELQRRLLVEGVAPERRAPFIAAQPPALGDPYTERPFELVGGTIRFQGHGARDPGDGVLSVQL